MGRNHIDMFFLAPVRKIISVQEIYSDILFGVIETYSIMPLQINKQGIVDLGQVWTHNVGFPPIVPDAIRVKLSTEGTTFLKC